MWSSTVKESHIGSMVSEILSCKHTHNSTLRIILPLFCLFQILFKPLDTSVQSIDLNNLFLVAKLLYIPIVCPSISQYVTL